MNSFLLILNVAIVLAAIAAPVVLALRRRTPLAAALAVSIGFGAQVLLMSVLQSTSMTPEQGALAVLVGIPAIAIFTCVVMLIVIARMSKPQPRGEPKPQ